MRSAILRCAWTQRRNAGFMVTPKCVCVHFAFLQLLLTSVCYLRIANERDEFYPQRRITRRGITSMAIPNRKPPILRIRGVRLCSGILANIKFSLIHFPKSGGNYHHDGEQAAEANNSECKVGTSEDGPGFHVSFSN